MSWIYGTEKPQKNNNKINDSLLGQKFAGLEMKVMISGLLRKYSLEPVTKPSELEYITDLVLRAKNKIYVKFCARK